LKIEGIINQTHPKKSMAQVGKLDYRNLYPIECTSILVVLYRSDPERKGDPFQRRCEDPGIAIGNQC
jgi:hypothetical protein